VRVGAAPSASVSAMRRIGSQLGPRVNPRAAVPPDDARATHPSSQYRRNLDAPGPRGR
jgi:hypothetical protein